MFMLTNDEEPRDTLIDFECRPDPFEPVDAECVPWESGEYEGLAVPVAILVEG